MYVLIVVCRLLNPSLPLSLPLSSVRPIDDSDHNLVLVVGLVSAVAVIIVVVFVAIVIVLCMRRKKAKNQGRRQHRSKFRRYDDDGDEDSRGSSGSLSGSSIMPRWNNRRYYKMASCLEY